MEDVESRFLHLLQPIRDLTKNWEVDVAAQLGEYLEELDQISISFDGGKTTMNFIEAALVIQGSACIYSRKVEYLYSLVYQALDFISNKKREKQPCSVGEDGRDADATFGTEEEEFLSLDDIKDSSQGSVDMRREQQPSAVNIVPLTPMSLVPPEEAEKKNNPLFSHKGEVLASRKDFRMNTCTPHATGAFMLELGGLLPTGLQDWHHEGSVAGAAGARSSVLGGGREPLHLGAGATPVQALNFSEDGGAAGLDDSGDDLPMVPEDNVETAPAAHEHIEAQRGAPQAKGYTLRERAPAQDPQEHIKMLDPWQSLDPFGDSEDKPFKKGRPFLVPQGLDDVVGSKRKRKGPRKLQDFLKWFSASYSDAADGRRTKRKGPTFADLEVLYWKQLKERLAAQRKLQSRARPPWVPPLEREEELEALEEEHEDDDFRGDAEEGPEDFLEQEDIPLHAPEPAVEGDVGPCDLDALSYEELVRRNVELFIANSQRYVQETELSQHIRQWEEKMGPLLQEQAGGGAGGLEGGRGAALTPPTPPFSSCRRNGRPSTSTATGTGWPHASGAWASGSPSAAWWRGCRPSRCAAACWPPCSWPTTTRWRWRRTRAWRRRWTPCGCGCCGRGRLGSASKPTAPPCSATEPPRVLYSPPGSRTAPPGPVQPPLPSTAPLVYSSPPQYPLFQQ